jgi:hypothetical protein
MVEAQRRVIVFVQECGVASTRASTLMADWTVRRTVTPEEARDIFLLTLTQRLEVIAGLDLSEAVNVTVGRLLQGYVAFLQECSASETDLLQRVADDASRHRIFQSAAAFWQFIFEAVEQSANRSHFTGCWLRELPMFHAGQSG